MLEFNIRNQEISRIDGFSPAEKSVGYLVAKFNFKTDDWNGASKIAVFKNLKTKEEYDRKLEEDACIVPSEALSEKGQFEVSVYGLKDGQKITSNVATCNLNRTLSGGSMTEDNSLNAAEKLLLEAQNKLDKSGHAPNKFLGTDEKGNVVTKEQEEFSLEVADEKKLGGVKPLNKTDDMTLEVGVDKDGRLFAKGKDITVDSKLSEESENPVQNKVLTKEVNTLKEHNTQLKETIEKLQIKVTTEKASFHNIKDSANMKVVDFGMEGKTEQKTTSGKNLFDISMVDTSITTKNTDVPVAVIAGEKYTLSGSISNSGAVIVLRGFVTEDDVVGDELIKLEAGSNTSGRISKTDIWEGEYHHYSVRYYGATARFYDIQLELGSVATTYEPYTNGPSPNPDFPQEIVNAGVYNEATGRYDIGCRFISGNIMSNNWEMCKNISWGAVVGTKPSIYNTNNKSIMEFDVISNTKVCFHNDTTDKYWLDRIVELDEEGNGLENHTLYYSLNYNYSDYSFQILPNTKKLLVEVALVDNTKTFTEADLEEMKIAFGYGDSVSYVSHASQQITLTSPVPITKWDKLVKRDGVYGWSIQAKEYVFDGTEFDLNSNDYTEERMRAYITSALAPKGTECYCNMFRYHPSEGVKGTCGYWFNDCFCTYIPNEWLEPYGFIYNPDDKNTMFTNARISFKALLADKGPIRILVNMQEEQAFHPLLDEEQTLLNNLETYYGVTNVYNEQGCPISLTYVSDPELHWNQKLLQIQQAMI